MSLSLLVLTFIFLWTMGASGAVQAASPGHYLFAWAGDRAGKAEDFVAGLRFRQPLLAPRLERLGFCSRRGVFTLNLSGL